MMGVPEAARAWGYSPNTVRKWYREGKIPGAEQDGPGKPWRIPDHVQPPTRRHRKSKYAKGVL